MIIEENLDTYFADLGQEVVFNGITKKGLLNIDTINPMAIGYIKYL